MKVTDVVQQVQQSRVEEAKKLLSRQAFDVEGLAGELKVSQTKARAIIRELRMKGANFIENDGKLLLHSMLEHGGHLAIKPKDRGDGWIVFGFCTDKHMCNKQHRADVLKAAYQTFRDEGVTDVFDAGNWIDGEARFNRQELLVFGLDDQLEYLIEEHPQVEGITTHYISGDDHEGWYAARERINVGKLLEMKAKEAGRSDLDFLGHVEADVELQGKGGSAIMRVMHPGGGSSYAFSYAPQKIVESFQGGEKPAILLIGHYHKFEYSYPREVHAISGGCAVDQTMFMRKNKIAAHVGFSLVKVKQDPGQGHVTHVGIEWHPFYDRGFYEKRF